jgi:hypothetical protein
VVTCGQLGGDVVLVGESAEDLLPVDPVLGEVDRFGPLGTGLGIGICQTWGDTANKENEGAIARHR